MIVHCYADDTRMRGSRVSIAIPTPSSLPPQHLVDRLIRELIRALVARNAGVTFHPVPFDAVSFDLLFERLPEIDVLHGLAVRSAPIATFPLLDPFENAVTNVLRIGVERHRAGAIQCGERANRGRELHAIVRGERFRAAQLFAMRTEHEHGAPAARAWIAAARAVRIDDDFRSRSCDWALNTGNGSFGHEGGWPECGRASLELLAPNSSSHA